MRDFIIVTVKGEKPSFNYDMELPTNVPVKRLAQNIEEALIAYNHSLGTSLKISVLYCERMKRGLPSDRTLAEIGIWNGDILILK